MHDSAEFSNINHHIDYNAMLLFGAASCALTRVNAVRVITIQHVRVISYKRFCLQRMHERM